MALTHTGLTSAPALGPGSTIERTYWAVPQNYTPGAEYDTEAEAVAAALAAQEAAVEQSAAQPGNNGQSYVPERFCVDLRWLVRLPAPAGGSTDMVARRTTYETLDDARRHLACLRPSTGG